MNKRSAIALAGGVTGALVSGVAGYSLSLNHAANAQSAVPKPIVRTEIRTITIHKKAKAPVVKTVPATIVVRHASSARSTHSSTPPVHHTGASAHHGGDDNEGGGDGGGD